VEDEDCGSYPGDLGPRIQLGLGEGRARTLPWPNTTQSWENAQRVR
jgi:hypothetical protein